LQFYAASASRLSGALHNHHLHLKNYLYCDFRFLQQVRDVIGGE